MPVSRIGAAPKTLTERFTLQTTPDCSDSMVTAGNILPYQTTKQYARCLPTTAPAANENMILQFDENNKPILVKTDVATPKITPKTTDTAPSTTIPSTEGEEYHTYRDILAKLAKGEKFEELAKQHSDCPSGKEGGKLGDYNPDQKMPQGQMVPEFTEAFNGLKPGETTTAPVKTQFGYHIIKASDVIVRTLEEVAPQIREMLKNEQLQQKVPAIIEQIKKDFSVKLYTDATK